MGLTLFILFRQIIDILFPTLCDMILHALPVIADTCFFDVQVTQDQLFPSLVRCAHVVSLTGDDINDDMSCSKTQGGTRISLSITI